MKPSSWFINGGLMSLYNLGKRTNAIQKMRYQIAFSDAFALSLNKKPLSVVMVTKIANRIV